MEFLAENYTLKTNISRLNYAITLLMLFLD